MLLYLRSNSPQLPVTLRDISVKGNLSGSLTVLLPDASGSLFIDEQIRISNCKNNFSASLPEGTHRIEWFDSIQNRCYGETVNLKPFSMKTISLQRFSYVKQ